MVSASDRLAPIRHLYPFASNHLDVGGARMHYVDEGPRGSPGAVVMLHGNPTWSFYYRNLILALRDRHRVIAPDHVGCGLSDKPQEYDYCLARHIENFTRLMDSLDLRDVTLVVHDWGGPIGLGWGVNHPDRVSRLVILNTAAFFGSIPLRIRFCGWPVVGPLVVRGLNGFLRTSFWMGVADRTNLPQDVRAGYLLPYQTWAERIAILQFVQDIPTHPRHRTYALVRSIDERLAVLRDRPALICWGMRDFCFTPWFLAAWSHRFPAAKTVQLLEAGHYCAEEAYPAIAQALRGHLVSQVT